MNVFAVGRRSRPSSLVLAAGLCACLGAPPALAFQADDLPLSRITLYRSGVGSFVRQGMIEGDADVSLRFRTDQINDILKSMVVLDMGGGRVEGATYNSKEPLSRRLGSFAVDISDNPGRAELLNRLRGARVEVRTVEGSQRGTVLGVERSTIVHPEGQQEEAATLTLVTDSGLWSTGVEKILSFSILDEELAAELQKALAALAEHRADNVKTVDLSFEGGGERDVIVGYVHEAPVWKTSYRLVLPDTEDDRLTLQGWAIVENTTEEDWENVTLSLVSGQPVSFVMDLYEPVFVDRPEVPVPTGAGAKPRSYAAGQSPFRDDQAAEEGLETARSNAKAGQELRMLRSQAPAAADSAAATMSMGEAMRNTVAAAATGEDVGEVFQYTLDTPVTVGRQQSAMLPIIAGPIDGRRVSIYTGREGGEHPMRGIELANDTGLQLMPGPIAVFDGTTYAGDAQIGHVSRGDDRLISYAVDLDVQARAEPTGRTEVQRISIVQGMLRQQMVEQSGATYFFENNDQSRDRTLIVEHPRLLNWELVDTPSPEEVTDQLYRFELEIAPGAQEKLSVTQRRTRYEQLALLDFDTSTLMGYFRNGKVSQEVVDAFREAQRLQAQVRESERRLAELRGERDEIAQDQSRIRSNMQTIDRNSDLYARYMQKLSEQETRLEQIVETIDQTNDQLNTRRQALQDYLRGLNVE